MRRPATFRSYSGFAARRWRMKNATSAGDRDHARARATSVALVRDRREVDREDQRADEDDGEDAAEVVDRVARLVHVARARSSNAIDEGDDRERQRDEEHRAPPELLEQTRPETSGPSAAIAPPSADQSAIDFVRPGPDHSAVISASVVGYAMPAASPPPTRATNEHLVGRRERREQRHRDRERRFRGRASASRP